MSSRNLLVVDDDPAVIALLTSILNREDRHVVGAYDGHTALDEFRRAPYDLVVAGLSRNGMDSMELLRRTRQIRPATPVILTSEHAEPGRVLRAIREHAYSYFHKPLAPGAVADMVQQALATSDWENDIEILSARPEWITATVRCKLDAGDRMVQFLREVTSEIAAAAREDIVSAFRELMMNSIEHGGKSDPAKVVRLSLLRTERAFIAQLQDPGPGFSMETIPHAAVSNPLDSPTRHVEIREEQGQRPGGFGILMARNLVDELVYNECGNEVMFLKYLA